MTVVVTRDVAPRFRGFLASCMLEIAPGVYTAPRMTRGVRERVWLVLEEWFGAVGGGGIVMTWADAAQPGGQGIQTLGSPPRQLRDHEGVVLAWQPGQAPAQREAERGSTAGDPGRAGVGAPGENGSGKLSDN
ncbi:MAG TPA: type I-E CRISPR-associated endoribonuclease Cas2e [Polyangia bacterium]